MTKGLGSGLSGVPGVHWSQEKQGPERAKPFQVKPGGVHLARVSSPAEGAAKLQGLLQRQEWPRPVARFSRSGGLVVARLVILTRNRAGNWRRSPDLRAFRNACDALAWSVERLKLSDRLEVALIRDGLLGLEAGEAHQSREVGPLA